MVWVVAGASVGEGEGVWTGALGGSAPALLTGAGEDSAGGADEAGAAGVAEEAGAAVLEAWGWQRFANERLRRGVTWTTAGATGSAAARRAASAW